MSMLIVFEKFFFTILFSSPISSRKRNFLFKFSILFLSDITMSNENTDQSTLTPRQLRSAFQPEPVKYN